MSDETRKRREPHFIEKDCPTLKRDVDEATAAGVAMAQVKASIAGEKAPKAPQAQPLPDKEEIPCIVCGVLCQVEPPIAGCMPLVICTLCNGNICDHVRVALARAMSLGIAVQADVMREYLKARDTKIQELETQVAKQAADLSTDMEIKAGLANNWDRSERSAIRLRKILDRTVWWALATTVAAVVLGWALIERWL